MFSLKAAECIIWVWKIVGIRFGIRINGYRYMSLIVLIRSYSFVNCYIALRNIFSFVSGLLQSFCPLNIIHNIFHILCSIHLICAIIIIKTFNFAFRWFPPCLGTVVRINQCVLAIWRYCHITTSWFVKYGCMLAFCALMLYTFWFMKWKSGIVLCANYFLLKGLYEKLLNINDRSNILNYFFTPNGNGILQQS